ncbi:alpha-hydroxy-acid oxidizing protein [Ruminococcaceae bacterium OttesenSCG-928-L11]|nr:alpha-hydroxy-acid oxidizing protein [Ruminococcaceae bacterium OttesenSCG-928-L11]
MAEEKRPGDSNRITREYIDSLLVEMRHLDAAMPSTAFPLFGETFSTPVMTAALSHLQRLHPDGMVELARGAVKAGAVLWTGMGDESELAAITATGAKTIKIIKPYADNEDIYRKIRHAEECGVIAVGIDVDHAFNRNGGYDIVHDRPMRPKSTAEIRDFAAATRLPFLIKGVLGVKDALKCVGAGVAGIVVSHHHGIMDFAVPPLMALPEIRKAVGGDYPLFVDCGLESGMDVFKALALGATACSVGRALMGPLGESGADGVAKAIANIAAGLVHTMAMTASPDLTHIDPSVIHRAQ